MRKFLFTCFFLVSCQSINHDKVPSNSVSNNVIPRTIHDETKYPPPYHRVNPRYPNDAISNKIEGFVVLGFDVDLYGRVKNITVKESVPNSIFDEAAIVAFQQWKFARLIVDGEPKVQRNLQVKLEFKL